LEENWNLTVTQPAAAVEMAVAEVAVVELVVVELEVVELEVAMEVDSWMI
jgi:hypothetical protein